MKKLLLFAICVMALFASCTKQVKEKPFDVRNVDSVTVKDGNNNPVKLSIKYLLSPAYNDIFKSEDDLNCFFESAFWYLKQGHVNPHTFKPTNIASFVIFNDEAAYEYNGEKIYHLETMVQGIITNNNGKIIDIEDILDLIAWREKVNIQPTEDMPSEEYIYWHIMPNNTYYEEELKKDIDKKLQNN